MAIFKVYLDACVLNRLSDDQSQERIRLEAQAVERIVGLVLVGRVIWVASRALEVELQQNRSPEKRKDALELFRCADSVLAKSPQVEERGLELGELGYGAYDALHLAFAEAAGVDVLLTTDDRFIRQAARGLGRSFIRVVNPIHWLREVQDGSD